MFPPLRLVLVVGGVMFVGVYLGLGLGVFEMGTWDRVGLAACFTGGMLAWLSNRWKPRP